MRKKEDGERKGVLAHETGYVHTLSHTQNRTKSLLLNFFSLSSSLSFPLSPIFSLSPSSPSLSSLSLSPFSHSCILDSKGETSVGLGPHGLTILCARCVSEEIISRLPHISKISRTNVHTRTHAHTHTHTRTHEHTHEHTHTYTHTHTCKNSKRTRAHGSFFAMAKYCIIDSCPM